jgi:regulator of nucleoside diphosphate kinase
MTHIIVVTRQDYNRLKVLVTPGLESVRNPLQPIIDLRTELERAVIVDPKDVPQDVVTMRSVVRLVDLDTKKEEEYRLVYPHEADIREGKISVLAPIGTAIIGAREGETIEWNVPNGVRRLKIRKVTYQPEAAGDYFA